MLIAPGTRLGRYEVSSQLGAGGMGEVYLAQDTHLRRPAALKILPARFTESDDRLRRFEREASAASALNHPNIITIHEIGREDAVHFMAMEFVDGETLRARLDRGELTLREALDIAIQVADALAAAHEAGIVHRDIKPENVMIRRDGYVKVLDFGLAKLTERQGLPVDSQAPTIAKAETDPGTVMGTMQYMAPEQARGLDVDRRADIWSLGVVLYEMLTGRAPFAAETPSDVIVALLSHEPAALTEHGEEVPYELERIVRKALQKNREERYQTIKDMALDLKSLRRELEVGAELERSVAPASGVGGRSVRSGAHARRATAPRGSRASTGGWGAAVQTTGDGESFVARLGQNRRALLLGLALVAAAGLVAFALYKFFASKSAGTGAGLFKRSQVVKLTNNGNTKVAAISPDGKYVAYAMDEGGKQSLWLRQVAISSNVRLLPPAEVQYYVCAFSADGDFIFYVMGDGKTPPAIYKLPVLGGSPTKVIDNITAPIIPSPDGKQLAVVNIDRAKQEVTLSVSNLDRTGERKLMSRQAPEFFDWVAWSPDGKSIAVPVRGFADNNPHFKIVEVSVADGSEKVIATQPWISGGQIAWLADKSGLVMTARSQDSSFDKVWHISYPNGEVQAITNDLNDYTGVSVSADSTALVAVQTQRLSNIWLSKSAKDYTAAQITPGVGNYYDLAWTPDGRILYSSDASGSADIWEMSADGTNQKQLTAGAGRNYGPVASPDGRYIVFHSDRSGTWQIWRMDRDGSNPRQMTPDGAESTWAQVTPDSRFIIYQHLNAKPKATAWRMGIDGGEAVELTDKLSLRPAVSPDGKWVACWRYGEQPHPGLQVVVFPSEGGEAVKSFDVTSNAMAGWDTPVKWTADGNALTYEDQLEGVGNIWRQPIEGGKPERLTDFKEHQIFSFEWLRDGRLVCSRGFRASDAVLIKEVR
jgi:Tol biopolymer transport system component